MEEFVVLDERIPYFGDAKGQMACSESTLRLLIERGVVDMPVEVVKLMSGMHGCMGHCPNCGAVNGAVAAIGANFGRCEAGPSNAVVYKLVNQFMDAFSKEYGTVKCPELMADRDEHSDEQLHLCAGYVIFAADTVQKMIEDEKKLQAE